MFFGVIYLYFQDDCKWSKQETISNDNGDDDLKLV